MKKQLVLFLALALCLGLTACGDTESDDTQSGYETVMDMEFLDGMWSIDGTAKLYFDSTEGFYAYRTRWGLGGRGEFELSEASGRPMIFFNGLLYNFLLRDDGVLLPNRNGEGSGLTIHRNTFLRDDEAEIVEWDISNWDGMWQNALGETIVINSSLMQYIACSPDYSMSGTMDDEGEGMGLYLYDNGTRAYLCPGDDGNSFTLSAERFGRYGDDQHFDGVFYRDADFYAYRANMASSGAEIRINGRAIQHGLYNEIWGKALHPSQNRFLAQIDILSDQAEALPDTKAAKNGLREDDEKVAALFSWIRANIPEPFKEEGREQMLVRLLAEKKSAEPGVLRVSTEKNLYQCLNLQIKSDLFVSTTEGVTLFEAKAGGSKAEDLYQLRMYHDGCVADDMEVREAALIAQRHPDTVKALLTELNRQKDKKGRPYHFTLTTWEEEGIALPPDAA